MRLRTCTVIPMTIWYDGFDSPYIVVLCCLCCTLFFFCLNALLVGRLLSAKIIIPGPPQFPNIQDSDADPVMTNLITGNVDDNSSNSYTSNNSTRNMINPQSCDRFNLNEDGPILLLPASTTAAITTTTPSRRFRSMETDHSMRQDDNENYDNDIDDEMQLSFG